MKYHFLVILSLFVIISSNAQNTILALSNTPNDLYSIDINNCSRTLIGNTGQQFGDIAFTTDGRLWGITGGILFEINPLNAVSDSVGVTFTNAVSLVGLNDSVLLAESDFSLYAINVNTAQATIIDTIGYQANGDLTWYDNDLYIVTGFPGIIKITLNNTNTGIDTVVPIENLSLPNCEGAVTASFEDNYNSIIGFNSGNVTKICRLDGSFEILCEDLNFGGTPGAAAMRLPTQSPLPNSCEKTNSTKEMSTFEPIIYPNPTKNSIHIVPQGSKAVEIKIIDVLGRQISSDRISEKTTVELANYGRGVYLIVMEIEGKRFMQRIVVE